MGGITEIATSAPGYSSVRPNTTAPLAETLKLNGYSTAQFGKCHEVPVWETSPMGPFDAWPTGGGASSTSTASSAARPTSGTRRSTRAPRRSSRRQTPEEGYHFTEDMTDKAIELDPPAEGAHARQAVLHLLRARAPPTPRTTCRRSGSTSTRASSTRAGTRCARRPSPARRSSASSRPTPS